MCMYVHAHAQTPIAEALSLVSVVGKMVSLKNKRSGLGYGRLNSTEFDKATGFHDSAVG